MSFAYPSHMTDTSTHQLIFNGNKIMNESEQKRFKWLCDEGEMAKMDELQELVSWTKALGDENVVLRNNIASLQERRKGLYRRWVDGWSLTGADLWGMVAGHAIIVIGFVFAMVGAFATVRHITHKEPPHLEAILTDRYYLSRVTNPNVGTCTEIMQEVLHGHDVTASACFKEDKDALEWAKQLVEITGGTFKREETKATEELGSNQRLEQELGRPNEKQEGR